jgi:CRISPR type IV-associated protein Csf1
MTPTQLIYEAWRNTTRPIIYNTSDGKGNDLKTICEFSDPILHEDYDPTWSGMCLICGAESRGGIPSKKMLGSNYTDWSRHKSPESDHICPACAFTMLLNTESSRCTLYRYSFIAAEQLHICNRAEMRDWIINPPEPPFVMAVAVSQKKHLAIKSRVSYNRDTYFCMLEEECIQVNRHLAKDIINICEALRGIGFTKDEIAKGTIRYDKIKDFKSDCYDKINHLLRPCMGMRVFALCLHVSQKKNEEDAVCYLGLTPRTKTLPPDHCSSMLSTKAETQNADRPDTTCGNKSNGLPEGRQSGQAILESF